MAEEIISSVVGKVVVLLFGVAKKEISYMWNYSQNVDEFKKVVQDIKAMTGRVTQHIKLAKTVGDTLLVGVEQWVDTANVEISKAEVFLEQEANAKKTCFNWTNLYRYSKIATVKASSLLQHQEGGKTFENGVSVHTPAPGPLDFYQNKKLEDITTHKLVLEKVIAAIEDESIQIIGIYGLGGVGKTTLAMEVASKMKNQFAKIAFTTVSQTVNLKNIQKDTKKASEGIINGEKVLIILDDVWEELEFEKLCIPCGDKHMNCRILLTSRSDDVCDKMNVQSKICVDSLPLKEAWIIFKQVAGERVEKDVRLKEIAIEVVKECGGLPLIILAIGKALKNKSIGSWEKALTQLKKHAPSIISPGIRKVYTHLKLSYDYLESEEVKSCFLMCSMFPEDFNIYLGDLVYYGVGLAMFNDLESLNDAIDMVRNAVHILKSSGLLLIDGSKGITKMHDVVRDVALLIASKGNNNFLVKAKKDLSEWLPSKNTLESYTAISLMDNKICKLPDYELHLPNLNTFLISGNKISTISNEFIGSMKDVRILDMTSNKISSLPQSLKLLTKLRILNLNGNKCICEIAILGELKDLEILNLLRTGIKEIPHEIGQLVNLRRFDVRDCYNLSHISPGVLLNLYSLEELCIDFSSMHEGIYDRLLEVTKLTKLTHLELVVPSYDVIPEGFSSAKLKRIQIQVGDYLYMYMPCLVWRLECYLIITMENLRIPFLKWIKKFIEVRSPHIYLTNIYNLNNILPTLYHEGFNKLESIQLYDCIKVSSLVDSRDWDEFQTFHLSRDDNSGEGEEEEKWFMRLKHLSVSGLDRLEVLWKCPDQYVSLSNLVTLHIDYCPKLVRVFSVSVAQGLVSLQELSFKHCYGLVEVVWDGDEEIELATNIIVFPCLAKIVLKNLEIKSFCSGNSTIKYPSLVEVTIKNCKSMKKWGNGIQETPKLKFVADVPLDGPYTINDVVVKIKEAYLFK